MGAPAPCHCQVIRKDLSESKAQLVLFSLSHLFYRGRTDESISSTWELTCSDDYKKGRHVFSTCVDRALGENDVKVWVSLSPSLVLSPEIHMEHIHAL